MLVSELGHCTSKIGLDPTSSSFGICDPGFVSSAIESVHTVKIS